MTNARRRRSWFASAVVTVVVLVLATIAGSWCLLLGGGCSGSGIETPGSSTNAGSIDLGRAKIIDADPSTVVETERYGQAPANHVVVVMAEGQGRVEAEAAAAKIGGTVVGEIEFMNLFQIQTSGVSAQDLESAIQTASALPGVIMALPNGMEAVKATVWGKTCSPMHDPLYQDGDNVTPYRMIGMMEAWHILRASGMTLHDTHVGVVDTAVYTKSGHTFAPELYFPDADGVYVSDKVRVRGLEAKDTTDQPDNDSVLTHGTMVAHLIGADSGDGVTGVAGVLGDKLTISFGNNAGSEILWDAEDGDLPEEAKYKGFFLRSLVEIVRQIEDGAKVINLSYACDAPSDKQYWRAEAYAEFFLRMQTTHSDVLFVAAAGNENTPLNGSNYAPGGLRAANVITVGALDHTGDRATYGDFCSREELERIESYYKQLLAGGDIEPDQTLDEYIDYLGRVKRLGSNFAAGNGEVTLSACGARVPVGRDPDGKPVVESGTSLAAPQVAAAAALLKAIDPVLTAQQIKEILVRTAGTAVESGGTKVDVPTSVGGRVLRVDYAVLDVINRVRGAGNELVYDELLELSTVSLIADEGSAGYTVTASVPRVGPQGADLMITIAGDAEIVGATTQHVASIAQTATWKVTPRGDPVTAMVTRLDTSTCAFLELEGEFTASPVANTPPVAENITTSTGSEAAVPITLKGTDQDGDDLTYTVLTHPRSGRLTGSGSLLTYKPVRTFTGTDSFTYKVNDGKADSPAATVEITVYGLRWVRVGAPAVNPSNVRLKYYGGGPQPDYFPEARFEGTFTIFMVSGTSFTIDDRFVDHGICSHDASIHTEFDAPPAVLIPGTTQTLEAKLSTSGWSKDDQPAIRFQYGQDPGGLIEPSAYWNPWTGGWHADPSQSGWKRIRETWELEVPHAFAGDTFSVTAFLWNCPACVVTWTYRAQ